MSLIFYEVRMANKKGTAIWFVLNEEDNRLLNQSKEENGRSKKKEAEKRLSDHLRRFGVNWEKAPENN